MPRLNVRYLCAVNEKTAAKAIARTRPMLSGVPSDPGKSGKNTPVLVVSIARKTAATAIVSAKPDRATMMKVRPCATPLRSEANV